jgi:3-hydroxybutyryl-CoA dehydratase
VSAFDWSTYFDDLAVGQRFVTPARTVDERSVLMFAALTGDHHPAHTDERWAAAGPFGERIAHGMLVLSLAAGLVPFDPERVIALRRVAEVVFRRPVRLGDEIRVEGALEELRALTEDSGLTAWSWAVTAADGRPACRARVDVLWRRKALSLDDDPFAPTADGSVPVTL